MNDSKEVIGLVPAAGQGSRLGPSPCSKEVFPLVSPALADEGRLTVMADCLLEAYRRAGIGKVFFIIRNGKWDIPAYFGDGSNHGLDIGYLMMGLPWGTPFTLDQAFPFVGDKIVAMGFPDMQFQPPEVFARLLHRLGDSSADVVLGAMPQPDGATWDMVAWDDDQRVERIDIKRPDTDLEYCWFAAVWTPRFTRFLHDHLAALAAEADLEHGPEIYIGHVVRAAMDAGLDVRCEPFPEGRVSDLGTPATLCAAQTTRR